MCAVDSSAFGQLARPHAILPMTLVTKEIFESHPRVQVGLVAGPHCDYMLREMEEELEDSELREEPVVGGCFVCIRPQKYSTMFS